LLELELRPCAPWCIAGDGHGDMPPEDRICLSESYKVATRLREPVQYSHSWAHDSVEVLLWREREEPTPHIVLVNETNGHDTPLTFAEARGLAYGLLKLIDLAEETASLSTVVDRSASASPR
jgi:hypothetical protein